MFANNRSFDPDTLRVLQGVFEEATAALPRDEQTQERKAILASRILALAAGGESDPVRLRTAALLHVLPRAVRKKRFSRAYRQRQEGWGAEYLENCHAPSDLCLPIDRADIRQRHPHG